MKKIETEKLIRAYVILSSVLLILLVGGIVYTNIKLRQISATVNSTSQGVSGLQYDVKQLCWNAKLGCSY